MGIFRRSEDRKKQDEMGSSYDVPGIRTDVSGQTGLLTLDLDSFSPEARKGLLEKIAKQNAQT